MKKNRLFVLGIITMFVAILSLTLVSGTMARYTSTTSGSDTARVAKWSVLVGTSDAAQTNSFTVDLFKTIVDTKDDSNETDVKPETAGDKIIAPGTKGSFVIDLTNASEVTTSYAIDFTVTKTNNKIPVQFSINGTDWVNNIDDLDIKMNDADSPTNNVLAALSGNISYTIQWRWAYNGDDTIDTDLGKVGTDTITVEVKITFTQID